MYGKRSSGKQEYVLLKYPILLFVGEIYSQIPSLGTINVCFIIVGTFHTFSN